MRHDFDEKTKQILARRVGYRCSNPQCRKQTSDPQEDATKAISIGVAVHITAASPGGPRFDSTMSPEKRKSAENGIWMCQNCAKLIDSDEKRYIVYWLREWKKLSEEAALSELENQSLFDKPAQSLGKVEEPKLEELYLLFKNWASNIEIIYINHTRAMKGDISYQAMLDMEIERFDKNALNFNRLVMLIDLYFPKIKPAYERVIDARTKSNQFMLEYGNQCAAGNTDGENFLAPFLDAQNKFSQEVKRVIKIIAEQTNLGEAA
jgi:hypothetical protein